LQCSIERIIVLKELIDAILPSQTGTERAKHPAEQTAKARVVSVEEIRIYPSPIPACDVQFNHLLEERAKLSKELNLMDAMLAQCYTGRIKKQAVKQLIAFSNHIDDEMVERLKVVFYQIGY